MQSKMNEYFINKINIHIKLYLFTKITVSSLESRNLEIGDFGISLERVTTYTVPRITSPRLTSWFSGTSKRRYARDSCTRTVFPQIEPVHILIVFSVFAHRHILVNLQLFLLASLVQKCCKLSNSPYRNIMGCYNN